MSDAASDPAAWESANLEAYLALSGARADVAGVLARFLRSDAPIDPLLRLALADALEGKRPPGCPNLVVTQIGRGPKSASGLQRFRTHVAIAEDVERQILEGATRQEAERATATQFIVGEDLCHKAVTGYRKMQKWLATRHFSEPVGSPTELWRRGEQAAYLFCVGPLVR